MPASKRQITDKSPIFLLANDLHSFIREEQSSNRINIFLCGGSSTEQHELRQAVSKDISDSRSKYVYKCYMPEHLFMDVLFSHHKLDLLSLENLLADSVHCVAILLDSPGTIAELGAFANHSVLNRKLFVIMRPKYKYQRSFVNLGPIDHIRKNRPSGVGYYDLSPGFSLSIAKAIRHFSLAINRQEELLPITNLKNPVFAYDFYLSLIYILDPVAKADLHNIAILIEEDEPAIHVVVDAIISALTKDGHIKFDSEGLSTTQTATSEIFNYPGSSTSRYMRRKILTALRMDFLNKVYRKQGHRHGGLRQTWSICE